MEQRIAGSVKFNERWTGRIVGRQLQGRIAPAARLRLKPQREGTGIAGHHGLVAAQVAAGLDEKFTGLPTGQDEWSDDQ